MRFRLFFVLLFITSVVFSQKPISTQGDYVADPAAFKLIAHAGRKDIEGCVGIQYHLGEAMYRNIVLLKIN
jgi:hypothetical protein